MSNLPSARPAGESDPFLLADHLALDFLNSRASPDGAPIEWLSDGRALLRWMSAAGLGLAEAPADVGDKPDDVAEAARGLREWWREFVRDHAGSRLKPSSALSALAPLNGLLAEDDAHRQVVAHDGKLCWSPPLRRNRRAAVLQTLAAACGDLVCSADFSRVRACEGLGCTLWFLDVTKAGNRRWCSMALCGNRAKVRAHRQKHRAARDDSPSR